MIGTRSRARKPRPAVSCIRPQQPTLIRVNANALREATQETAEVTPSRPSSRNSMARSRVGARRSARKGIEVDRVETHRCHSIQTSCAVPASTVVCARRRRSSPDGCQAELFQHVSALTPPALAPCLISQWHPWTAANESTRGWRTPLDLARGLGGGDQGAAAQRPLRPPGSRGESADDAVAARKIRAIAGVPSANSESIRPSVSRRCARSRLRAG